MEKSLDAFRTISEVADLLDVPAHVLRFWETRFPQVRPVKRAGGRRYYRPGDVALLAGLRLLLHDQGMTIRGAQKILREQGVRHVTGLGAGTGPLAAETVLPPVWPGDETVEAEVVQMVAGTAGPRPPPSAPPAPPDEAPPPPPQELPGPAPDQDPGAPLVEEPRPLPETPPELVPGERPDLPAPPDQPPPDQAPPPPAEEPAAPPPESPAPLPVPPAGTPVELPEDTPVEMPFDLPGIEAAAPAPPPPPGLMPPDLAQPGTAAVRPARRGRGQTAEDQPLPLWAAAESLPPVGETSEPMARLIRLTGQLRAAALTGPRPDPARLAPLQDRLAALIAARGAAAPRD